MWFDLLFPEELPLADGLAVLEQRGDLIGINDAEDPDDDPDADARKERRDDDDDDALGRLAQVDLPRAAQQDEAENQGDDRVFRGTGGCNLRLALNQWHSLFSYVMK
jgi:hypothetical protein